MTKNDLIYMGCRDPQNGQFGYGHITGEKLIHNFLKLLCEKNEQNTDILVVSCLQLMKTCISNYTQNLKNIVQNLQKIVNKSNVQKLVSCFLSFDMYYDRIVDGSNRNVIDQIQLSLNDVSVIFLNQFEENLRGINKQSYREFDKVFFDLYILFNILTRSIVCQFYSNQTHFQKESILLGEIQKIKRLCMDCIKGFPVYYWGSKYSYNVHTSSSIRVDELRDKYTKITGNTITTEDFIKNIKVIDNSKSCYCNNSTLCNILFSFEYDTSIGQDYFDNILNMISVINLLEKFYDNYKNQSDLSNSNEFNDEQLRLDFNKFCNHLLKPNPS